MEPRFSVPCITVTSNQGQGHIDCYQTVDFSSIYYTTLEQNWLKNLQMHTKDKVISSRTTKQQLFPLLTQISLTGTTRMFSLNCFITSPHFLSPHHISYHLTTFLITSPHFFPFYWKMWERMKQPCLAWHWHCDPQPWSRSLTVI